jgi:hypothetical protein
MQRLRLGFFIASLVLLLTACPEPGETPEAPTNVQPLGGVNKITVTWDSTGDVDGFNVYRSQGGDLSKVNTSLIPSDTKQFIDEEVSPGIFYRYAVTAVKGGLESAKSDRTSPVKSTNQDTQNPSVTLTSNPASLTSAGSVTLTANATDDGTISKVEFFRGTQTTPFATDTNGSDGYRATNVSVDATTTFKAIATDSTGKTGEDTVEVEVDGGGSSCEAEAKSFMGVVNTPIKGGTRSAGEIARIVSPLIAESCDDDALRVSTPIHGDVTVNSDGTFTYTPDFKYVGTDSFQYSAGGETATVNLTVEEVSDTVAGNQYIYFVDNASSGPATGSLADPFQTITSAEAESDPGDIIYIHTGDDVYVGTVNMKANQKFIGAGTDFVVNDLTLAEAGTKPRFTATKYGFDLGNGGENVPYANVGILEIKGLTIQNVSGGPTLDADGSGIRSDNLQGTLLIEDVNISGVTGHGMYIDHNNHDKPVKHEIIVRNVVITNPGQYGIWVDDPTNFLIEDSQITGVKGGVTYGSNGIDAQDEFGNHGTDKPVVIRNVEISGNAGTAGIRFIKNNKCRANVNDNEQNCNNVTKEDSTIVVQGSSITTETGIIMQTQTGEEDKVEGGFNSHFEYFGDQGDVLLKYSGSSISCVKNVFEFDIPNVTPAQRTEGNNKITSEGITCSNDNTPGN